MIHRESRQLPVGARISDPRHTRNHMMEKFMTDSWDALRFDRAERSGGHAVMTADPKPLHSNLPKRHTLQRKLFSTSFFFLRTARPGPCPSLRSACRSRPASQPRTGPPFRTPPLGRWLQCRISCIPTRSSSKGRAPRSSPSSSSSSRA